MALYNWILPEFRSLVLNFLEYKPKEFGFILPFHRIESFISHPLSDFEPKGNVANNYGAYRKQDGVAERVLFVIDSDGWNYSFELHFPKRD